MALLPFVDEKRLLKALDARRSRLTEEERHRNLRRPALYFVHADTPIGQTLTALYDPSEAKPEAKAVEYEGCAPASATLINAGLTQGIAGHVWPDVQHACLPGRRMPSGVPGLLPDISAVEQNAISVYFENPPYPFGHVFPARLLDSVKMPPRCQLLPPTTRGRGRGGRGGGFGRGNFNGSNNINNNSNNRDWSSSGGTSWLADQTPAERMIRRSLPAANDVSYGASSMPIRHKPIGSVNRFQPYPSRQMLSNYPPAYPPPQGAFRNPYANHPPSNPDDGWTQRGGRGGGGPMLRRGGRGGSGGWQPRRGYYY